MGCCTSSSGRKAPKEPIPPQVLLHQYFMSKTHSVDDEEVKKACSSCPEKSLEIMISSENDTVLHIASRLKKKYLVIKLLDILPQDWNARLTNAKNKRGNNILHEIASDDSMKEVAAEMVERAPGLLTGRNKLGETPIFCAARYGQLKMFKFLAEKMNLKEQTEAARIDHLKRGDGTTALHISVYTECFELAVRIAESYPELIGEKDGDSMTALQHLACNPTAFEKDKNKPRKEIVQVITSTVVGDIMEKLKKTMKCFFEESDINKVREQMTKFVKVFRQVVEKARSKSAHKRKKPLQKLVEVLVKEDISWDTGVNSQEETHNGNATNEDDQQEGQKTSSTDEKYKKSDVAPLLLATMFNIHDIVEEFIKQRPEALGCTNKEGQNILQLAILYGNVNIFKMVMQVEVFAGSLSSAVDKNGNSILHMVGSEERSSQSSENMQSPAIQLRKELKLFKKVKAACKPHLTKRLNSKHRTAEELFASKNEKLHKDAKEWVMRTTENCTILSVFIATVAFAAAYTVPGGPDQNTGFPILGSNPWFVTFIVADVISLSLALRSVGIFLSVLTSSFALQDFETNLFGKLFGGMIQMILSVSMMAVAFGATIVLIWKDAAWSKVVAFFPVPIFFLSYSPLRSATIEWFKSLPVIILAGVSVISFVVGFLLSFFLLILIGLLYLLYKACKCIVCTPVRWICDAPHPSRANSNFSCSA